MTRVSFGLLAAAIVAWPGMASAQVGVGVIGSRPGGYYGGYVGIYGGACPGFWSNGYSLYGPPVPTYGSVPGYFGGSDQRLFAPNISIQNGASIGLGGPGSGGAGPLRGYYRRNDAAAAPQVATGQATINVPSPGCRCRSLLRGQQHSASRRPSPVPVAGDPGRPDLLLQDSHKWKQPDGTIADQERSVAVKAGETTIVDFTPSVKFVDKAPLLAAP